MKKQLFLALVFAIIALSLFVDAPSTNNPTTVWRVPPSSLSASFRSFKTDGNAGRCLDSNGQQLDLNVTVLTLPDNTLNPNATVDANVHKPNSDVNTVSFPSQSDGNYYSRHTFDRNGTYRLEVHARDGLAKGDVNAFVHVGSVGMGVSFPNNGREFSASTTQVITAVVKNTDGNIFEGILAKDANISINYPAGNSFVTNDPMSDSGDGNYTYTFTVPSTTGRYSVTASFKCGLNSDSNSTGFFTVPSGKGGGDEGGGRGGPSPATPAPEHPVIVGWRAGKGMVADQPASLSVVVQNSAYRQNLVLSVAVSLGAIAQYEAKEIIPGMEIGERREFFLGRQFTPGLAGNNIIQIKLFSVDETRLWDDHTELFEIPGRLEYDLNVSCLQPVVLPGAIIDASIRVLNSGDFFKDTVLSWWVEDAGLNEIGRGQLSLALSAKESRSLVRDVLVPASAALGNHVFHAELKIGAEKIRSSCGFSVVRQAEYFAFRLNHLEERLNFLELQARVKLGQGFYTKSVEEKISALRARLLGYREKFLRGEYESIATGVAQAVKEVNELQLELQSLERQPLPVFGTIAIVLVILLLLAGMKFRKRIKGGAEKLIGFERAQVAPKPGKPAPPSRKIDIVFGLK